MRQVAKIILTAVVAATAVAVAVGHATADNDRATHYYLALGDSLAQGFQFLAPDQPY